MDCVAICDKSITQPAEKPRNCRETQAPEARVVLYLKWPQSLHCAELDVSSDVG